MTVIIYPQNTGRVKVDHVRGGHSWNLVIHRVRPTDAGTYKCLVSSRLKQRKVEHYVALIIKGEKLCGTMWHSPSKVSEVQNYVALFGRQNKR